MGSVRFARLGLGTGQGSLLGFIWAAIHGQFFKDDRAQL